MQQKLKSLLPEEKIEAVERAYQSAFHTTEFESIVQLAGGLSSALVYKIIVNGKATVLRLIMQIDPLSDPVRQFACMNLAAEAGIAPHVYYSSTEDALTIIDFIEAKPMAGGPATSDELLMKMTETVKAIHALPLFPKLVNFSEGIDGFIQRFKETGILPESATAEHFRYYSQIQQAYPRHDPDVVSAHNDLNVNNILYDGEKIWLIDWEAAFQNDRYADLATFTNFFATTEAQEELCLKTYFGSRLDAYKRARFFLMRQVCYMFYSMIMLNFAAASKPAGFEHDPSMETLRLRDFHKEIGAGKISMASYEGQFQYGKTVLNEILHNMKSAKFAEAIGTVKQASQAAPVIA